MSKVNPLDVYKETHIKTASAGQIIVMLYDEGIKQIDFAIEKLESKGNNLDEISNALIKAQDIITELMASLDFERGGEVSQNLFSLYMFFNQRLIDANLKKDAEPVKIVRKLFSDLRGAWAEIIKKGINTNSDNSSGVNIAG